MVYSSSKKCWIATLIWFLLYSPILSARNSDTNTLNALIRLSADHIDTVFGDVASSTRALAAEYITLSNHTPKATVDEKKVWLKCYQVQDKTVGFHSNCDERQNQPAFQAPQPAFYAYSGSDFSEDTFRQLNIFQQLVPQFRTAYRSFDFSWTYLTTRNDMMLIYPFLPINEAVNNYPPDKQIFYTSANFKQREVGWTLPYLDLAGAGMMITASFPVYQSDTLIGVISHDITLDQLSHSVLNHLVLEDGAIAYIINQNGLVIGNSELDLTDELNAVNKAAEGAVLHYRSQEQLQKAGLSHATSSTFTWINNITEALIQRTIMEPETNVIRLNRDGRQLIATRTASTGWYVVLLLPDKK